MEFIINKLLLVFIFSNVYLGTEFDLPRFDLLILDNGQEIKCQVQVVSGGLVKVNVKNAEMTIVRELNTEAARDIVESGIIKNTRHSGRVIYFDDNEMELQTSSGVMKIKKGRIRKIVISQEPAFDL